VDEGSPFGLPAGSPNRVPRFSRTLRSTVRAQVPPSYFEGPGLLGPGPPRLAQGGICEGGRARVPSLADAGCPLDRREGGLGCPPAWMLFYSVSKGPGPGAQGRPASQRSWAMSPGPGAICGYTPPGYTPSCTPWVHQPRSGAAVYGMHAPRVCAWCVWRPWAQSGGLAWVRERFRASSEESVSNSMFRARGSFARARANG